MRKALSFVLVIALVLPALAGCKGGGNGPTGPDPIPTVHALDNIVFERVVVRNHEPRNLNTTPTIWIQPEDGSWSRECVQLEVVSANRWICRAGFDNLPAGGYFVKAMDFAAFVGDDPDLTRSHLVGERIWGRTNILFDRIEEGLRGETRAYIRINADGSITTTR